MESLIYCRLSFVDNDIEEAMDVHITRSACDINFEGFENYITLEAPLSHLIINAIINNTNHFEHGQITYIISHYDVLNWATVDSFRTPLPDVFTDANLLHPRISQIDLLDEKDTPIYVYNGNIRCIREGHEVESYVALVQDIYDKKNFFIKVYYCTKCDKYLIPETVLDKSHEMQLFPHLNLDDYDDGLGLIYSKKLKSKSKLALLGYHSGLADWQRQRLLAKIIENRISGLTALQIVNHLKYCIGVPGQTPTGMLSCAVWEDDIDFIYRLPLDTQQNSVIKGHFEKWE